MSDYMVDARFRDAVARYSWKENGCGYFYGRVAGRMVLLHRYVWSRAHDGVVPRMIDHINGNKRDCRLKNLRPATGSLNCRSRLRSSGGRLPEGVQPKRGKRPFFTHICLYRATLYLGSYESVNEASDAYERARRIILAAEAARACKWNGQPVPPPSGSREKADWNCMWRQILSDEDIERAVRRAVAFADSFVISTKAGVA